MLGSAINDSLFSEVPTCALVVCISAPKAADTSTAVEVAPTLREAIFARRGICTKQY
jgi:hypothetical protein